MFNLWIKRNLHCNRKSTLINTFKCNLVSNVFFDHCLLISVGGGIKLKKLPSSIKQADIVSNITCLLYLYRYTATRYRYSFIDMNHLFLRNIFLFSFHTKTPSKLTAAKAYTEYFSCMPTVEIARTHDVHKTRFQISIVNKIFIGLFVE